MMGGVYKGGCLIISFNKNEIVIYIQYHYYHAWNEWRNKNERYGEV